MSTKKDDFDGKKKPANSPGKDKEGISNKDILKTMSDHFEANKDEIIRAQTELPVIKPAEGIPGSYVQLKEILIQGYKTPEYDENGYCVHRPVFNSDTKILDFRLYSLVSSKYFQIASRLYSRYFDEPIILFREYDRKIILCLIKEGYSIAVKGGGLEGFSLNTGYKNVFELEYLYLMMRHEKFSDQFPQGMNALSILNGWIPRMNYLEQKETIKSYREDSRKELAEGLEILAVE